MPKIETASPAVSMHHIVEGKRHDSIVVLQQFSMRSYSTGKYNILADGNLNSMLHILGRFADEQKKVHGKVPVGILMTVPSEEQVENAEKAYSVLKDRLTLIGFDDITLEYTDYGKNALENRTHFNFGEDEFDRSLIVTYFKIDRNVHVGSDVLFICPGSPRPENPLYSVEEIPYFQEAVASSDMTFFYNDNQAVFDYEEKCFEVKDVTSSPHIDTRKYDGVNIKIPDYYFPYRLTDDDYKFKDLVLSVTRPVVIAITDPNESMMKNSEVGKEMKHPDNELVTLVKIDPKTHHDYVNILMLYIRGVLSKDRSRFGPERVPRIIISSSLSKTLHMAPVEMFAVAIRLGVLSTKFTPFYYFKTTFQEHEHHSYRALGIEKYR